MKYTEVLESSQIPSLSEMCITTVFTLGGEAGRYPLKLQSQGGVAWTAWCEECGTEALLAVIP